MRRESPCCGLFHGIRYLCSVLLPPQRQNDEREMKSVALYTTCPACDGHGRIPERPGGPRTNLCPECRGMGFTTTEEGRAIIDLVDVAKLRGLLPDAGV